MTPKEIIAVAREAGFRTGQIDLTIGEPIPFIAPVSGTSCIGELQRFAALVADKAAAKEREACAKLCDEQFEKATTAAGAFRADMCAEAIRARGTKEGV